MDAGIRVCINTDNRTVSNTTLAKEWQYLIDALYLSQGEIERIVLNSIDAIFAPEETKQTLLKAFNQHKQ